MTGKSSILSRLLRQRRLRRLGAYVISMASTPSDVLAVQLLLKSTGCSEQMPVVPLFETLADLESASSVVNTLLEDPAYLARIDKKLMVMIGYSDSAKDAGMLAAGGRNIRLRRLY